MTMQTAKISDQFSARLDQLRPRQKVRAIVMLDAGQPAPASRREARARRSMAVTEVREAAEAALPDLDRILERHQGRRLADHADALGCVPVEATADGISALAASEHVKAILEDQPISLLAQRKR
ncbi:MAG TPA: hypothetical protein VF414_00345 [Thermoanaerobaculia bacterium]